MKVKPLYFLIFLIICCVVGVGGVYLLKLNFWVAFAIGAASLLLNGLAAVWEDRGIPKQRAVK
jgi:hypothetical protein